MNTPVKEIASTGPKSVNFLKRAGLYTAQDIARLNTEEFEKLILNETHQLRHTLRNVKLNAEKIVPRLVPEAVAVRIEDIRYTDNDENKLGLCDSTSCSTTPVKEEDVLVYATISEGNKNKK
jgi:hypothetical protein